MLKTRIVTALIVLGGILFASLAFVMPTPGLSGTEAEAFRITLAFFFMNLVFNLGAATIFLLGLVGFTEAFRRSYYWICAGLVVQSIGAVAYTISLYVGAFGTVSSFTWAQIPLVIGAIISYIGFARFAKLLRAPTTLTNPWIVVGITLAVAVIAALAPHQPAPGGASDASFDFLRMLQITEMLFYFLTGIILMRIRGTASKIYRASLTWFIVSVTAVLIPTTIFFGSEYFAYPAGVNIDSLTLLIIVANLCTITSGYYFNKIAHSAEPIKSQGNEVVDAIILLASLVSRPSDIDKHLDELRALTATRNPGEPFTPVETKKLQRVYLDIKDYLATKEPLRKLTPRHLDDLVRERLNVVIPEA